MLLGLGLQQQTLANNPSGSNPQDPAAQQLLQQKDSRPWLGVEISNIPLSMASHFSDILDQHQGVMVQRVYKGSPADQLGLKRFDIIAAINDQKIFSAKQLSQLIINHQIGDEIELSYIQQARLNKKKIKLTAAPGFQASSQHRMSPHLFPGQGQLPDFQLPLPPRQGLSGGQVSQWSEFESISIESKGEEQYKVSVETQTNGGEKKKFTFEGKMSDIIAQINKLDDMPQATREKLIQNLEGNNRFALPDFDQFFDDRLIPPYFRQQLKWFQQQSPYFNRQPGNAYWFRQP